MSQQAISMEPIAPSDRVADVLARDENLVEVFVRHSKQFLKLRNRALRKVMARLVTVEQAAQVAAVPVTALVRDLNAAIGIDAPPAPAAPEEHDAVPDPFAAAPRTYPVGALVVDVDVRDDLRSGREPFSRIMAAVIDLPDDAVLHLRTIFEPAPLYAVLGKRGFVHKTHAWSPDDWSVWFWHDGTAAPAPAPAKPVARALPSPAPDEVWIDVRGLEPPEPMVRTLAALETLPPAHTLVQLNVRVPQFLLPLLVERGFTFAIDESTPDHVLVRIRSAGHPIHQENR